MENLGGDDSSDKDIESEDEAYKINSPSKVGDLENLKFDQESIILHPIFILG